MSYILIPVSSIHVHKVIKLSLPQYIIHFTVEFIHHLREQSIFHITMTTGTDAGPLNMGARYLFIYQSISFLVIHMKMCTILIAE